MSFIYKIAFFELSAYNTKMQAFQAFISNNPKIRKILIGLFLILILVGVYVIASGSKRTIDSSEQARQEATAVKASLGKHLTLPDGEEPDIRKITHPVDDPFFARAEIGDYLIIFYKSRIAYIYSPSKDIISNAGVVFINPQVASSTAQIKSH